MKLIINSFIFIILLAMTSCDGLFGNRTNNDDTINTQVDSTELISTEHVIKGIAVDGSRRNIYIANGDYTLDFELSPDLDLDFSWEIGDSVVIKYVNRDYGDSVTFISTDMALAK